MAQIWIIHGLSDQLFNLFDLVDQSVAVQEHLGAGFGNVAVIHQVIEHDISQVGAVGPVIAGQVDHAPDGLE